MDVHVRARVRHGRLVVDQPVDLPEGTEIELEGTAPGSGRRRPRFGSMAGRISMAPDFDVLPDDFGEYT